MVKVVGFGMPRPAGLTGGEEGTEIRKDGGWCGATEEGREKYREDGSICWREVFVHIQHYVL